IPCHCWHDPRVWNWGNPVWVSRDAESSERSAWRVNAARAPLRRLRVAANQKRCAMSEPLEGQEIARDILDGVPGAWDRFHEAYGERLLARAIKLLAACPPLRQRHQAADLVQDFLIVKVLRRPQVMFQPVADGLQPLWPRLCRSLVNHANTLLRPINRA